MPTKDRLKEFKKHPISPDEDTNLQSNNNDNCVEIIDEQQIFHHVIGSGGRLADFFDNVEKISLAIDSVKKSVDEVRSKQSEILSTTESSKLQGEINDLQSDIKNTVNSKIRLKVTFFGSLLCKLECIHKTRMKFHIQG